MHIGMILDIRIHYRNIIEIEKATALDLIRSQNNTDSNNINVQFSLVTSLVGKYIVIKT